MFAHVFRAPQRRARGDSGGVLAREETDEETPNVGTCLCAPAWGIGGFSPAVKLASRAEETLRALAAKSVPKIHVAPRVSANAPGEEPSLLIGDDRVFVVASNAAGKVRLRQEVVPGEYLRRQVEQCASQ